MHSAESGKHFTVKAVRTPLPLPIYLTYRNVYSSVERVVLFHAPQAGAHAFQQYLDVENKQNKTLLTGEAKIKDYG